MSAVRHRRWPAVLMALLTLTIVTTIAAVGWSRLQPQTRIVERRGNTAVDSASTQPALLETGRDYYVHVKLIELRETDPDGGTWDRGSAPDIFFRLHWNNTHLFDSQVRDDRLIAEWDLLRLDVRDALLSGHVDVASAVNAPLVRVEKGGVLRIEVLDEDVAMDDEAGRFDLPLENLREGVNTLSPAEGGVARLTIDMIPRETSLPDLLQRASDR